MTEPRVAVVTPYHREPVAVLRQAHESVLRQGAGVDHFMVADGHPLAELSDWNVRHVVLPQAHDDNGNTPRAVGSILADAQGYDFVAYLDADNWFHDGHVDSLLALWRQTAAPVCCALRTFHALDGRELAVREGKEEAFRHVDTSAYLIHRSAFDLFDVWHRMPRPLSPVCDQIFFAAVRHRRFATAFSKQRTVAFRSQYRNHYRGLGMAPPPSAKSAVDDQPRRYLFSSAGVRETVDRLGFWPNL